MHTEDSERISNRIFKNEIRSSNIIIQNRNKIYFNKRDSIDIEERREMKT